MDMRGQVAIVGVGHTAQGTLPGRTAEHLALEAIEKALCDAGVGKDAVDGLVTCKAVQGGGADVQLGPLLGFNPPYAQTLDYGTCNFSLHLAAMAIVTGLASTVVLSYGANARSGHVDFAAPRPNLASSSGYVHIAGPAAMALQRHKYLYGTTDEQFGQIAVSERAWAQLNPLAIFHDEMTINDYLARPYMVEPLRREDVTMISDGGVALVVTSADRVAGHPKKPVYLLGMAEHSGIRGDYNVDNLMRPWIAGCAERIWNSTGMNPSDVDVLYIQDPTAVWDLQMLEYYGFCPIGEGGPFLAEGHTFPGGDLPLNTNGGQLSESYMWGWLHIVEAVRQLRGECGPRQVPDATVAMYCSSMAFQKAACSIIGTER